MPDASALLPRPLPARQRTELLQRMLLIRHLRETDGGMEPGSWDFAVGEEAVDVGVSTALRPSDTLLLSDDRVAYPRGADPVPGPDAVVVRLVAAGVADAVARLEAARHRRPRTLILLRASTAELGRRGSVDGSDVEAVLAVTAAGLRAVRTGNGPLLLRLRTDDRGRWPDPVETLVLRMTMDHQLDGNALLAIDAAAAVKARAVRTATLRPPRSPRREFGPGLDGQVTGAGSRGDQVNEAIPADCPPAPAAAPPPGRRPRPIPAVRR